MSPEKSVPPNPSKTKDKNPATIDDDKKPKEIGGRGGPDPVRYGDWENKGIASDF